MKGVHSKTYIANVSSPLIIRATVFTHQTVNPAATTFQKKNKTKKNFMTKPWLKY